MSEFEILVLTDSFRVKSDSCHPFIRLSSSHPQFIVHIRLWSSHLHYIASFVSARNRYLPSLPVIPIRHPYPPFVSVIRVRHPYSRFVLFLTPACRMITYPNPCRYFSVYSKISITDQSLVQLSKPISINIFAKYIRLIYARWIDMVSTNRLVTTAL